MDHTRSLRKCLIPLCDCFAYTPYHSDQAGCPSGKSFIDDDPESPWTTSVLPSLVQYYSETFQGMI